MQAKPQTGDWLHGPKAPPLRRVAQWCRVPICPRDGRECNRKVGHSPRGPGFYNVGDLSADRRADKDLQSPRTRTVSIGKSGHRDPSHGATDGVETNEVGVCLDKRRCSRHLTHEESQDFEIDNT